MLNIEPKLVCVHKSREGQLNVQFEFDEAAPLAWGEEVGVTWCTTCFPGNGEHSADELGKLFDGIRARLQPAYDAHRVAAIGDSVAPGDRAKLLDRSEVLAAISRENTWLSERISEGRFPQPMFSGNKRVWLADEVALANARIIAVDTARARGKEAAKTHRPLNRHERRKLAARKA